MDVILGLIILSFLLLFWRVKRKALLQYEYECKLAFLRDELRWQLINGHIDNKSWVYEYLDTTMPIASLKLKYFNLYSAFGLALIHSNDRKFKLFESEFKKEIENPENKNLKIINDKFDRLILEYVLRKHFLFKIILVGVYLSKNKQNKNPPTSTEKKIYNLGLYPETSASGKFMPC